MIFLDRAAEILRAAGIDAPRREARLLLALALGLRQEDIVAGQIAPDAAGIAHFESLVARRATHEPFAYIAGRREFWSLDFAVGPGALIPRPESEILVEQALKAFPQRDGVLDVLDLGTGTGCLMLAFLSERENAHGVGVDISAEALVWATRNAGALGLSPRTQFVNADWANADLSRFDVVFANPPYVDTRGIGGLAPDVATYEPHRALDGGADGLEAYRAIAAILPDRLRENARAFVEIGQAQAEPVAKIFGAVGLRIAEIVPDLAGIPRCLVTMPVAAPVQQVKLKKDMEISARNG